MKEVLYYRAAEQMYISLLADAQNFRTPDGFLFQILYTAFCRHNPNFHLPDFSANMTQDQFYCAIEIMYDWYKRTYAQSFGSKMGQRGQQRMITDENIYEDGEYGFDAIYAKRTFLKMLTEKPKQNMDFRSFILHTAVAFAITSTELDRLLSHYMFRRLHAKNIHDVSIYAVLSTLPQTHIDPDINPFAEVKRLYEEARAIVKNVRKAPNHEQTAAEFSTTFLQNNLMELVNRELFTHERFVEFVFQNKDAFNMRHSMLLKEYRKLSELFSNIFDNRNFRSPVDRWPNDCVPYSWCSFTKEFCVDYSDPQKRFSEQFCKIDKEGKHPTREIMITLWMYAYFFLTVHGVFLTETMFDRICNALKDRQMQTESNCSGWITEAKGCYNPNLGIFNIRKFIFRDSGQPIDRFSGGELRTWLNEQLQKFELGSLNKNSKFDMVILQLCKFDISYSGHDVENLLTQSGYVLSYNGIRMQDSGGVCRGIDNVPYVLVAIVEVLRELKGILPNGELPLECHIYDSI